MKTLKEYIKEAERKGVAIGHFNISNLEGFHAIVSASRELGLAVVVGVSEGEEDAVGIYQAVALVSSARKEGLPVFLNADHHYSFERVKACVDAGFDAVIIDGAKLPHEENLALTKKCADYVKSVNPEIIIEAEIGFIGSGSQIIEKIPDGVSEETMTRPEEAKEFVEKTGIDLLAPSVGNVHGMVRGGNPRLDIARIKEVRRVSGVPLVLHGGSGIADEDFVAGIKAGISMVHINTELRVAYTNALQKALAENPNETTPYKYSKPAMEAMKQVVVNRLKLFNGM